MNSNSFSMMNLDIEIHNVKCISDIKLSLPLEPGLYAITGQNGSGKSTIVSCASSIFFDLKKDDFFGHTDQDTFIKLSFDGKEKAWSKDTNNKWVGKVPSQLGIQGFYEGSLIYGNRFRDTSYEKLRDLESIDYSKLKKASEFIRTNLGKILQGDENYYEELLSVSPRYAKFSNSLYFYKKAGKYVSQFHMSTGENLLVSILNSLKIKNNENESKAKDPGYRKPKAKIILLDEIELALHPSSLKRLVQFLEDMSKQYGYAIYFSTHSIELIGCISPERIFYVERHADNSMTIANPCYPAYATRNLYNHDGYDKVILVEDDLARAIVNRVLREEKLLGSKLVHVLPCGGYTHVIDFAEDAIVNNFLGSKTSVCLVLDADVRKEATNYKKSKPAFTVRIGYLPVASLEKYMRFALVQSVDSNLHKLLGDYIFCQRSLSDIIDEYRHDKDYPNDQKGKVFYGYLKQELESRRKNRDDLIEIVVDYWFDNRKTELTTLVDFLKNELQ